LYKGEDVAFRTVNDLEIYLEENISETNSQQRKIKEFSKMYSIGIKHLLQHCTYTMHSEKRIPFYLNIVMLTYRVSQNSRIPNSERGREGPRGARKILRKKIRSS
jgi:hypothetical protein